MEISISRKKMIFLFAASFMARLIFVLTLSPQGVYFDDEFEYLRMKSNFLAGNGLGLGGSLQAYRPPLYPLFITFITGFRTGFPSEIIIVRLAQVLISTFTVVLIYLIGKKVFSERIGLWAAIFSTLYPFFIFYTGFLLTETLFIFFVALAVWETIKILDNETALPEKAVRAGLWYALAGLCRPTMELFFPFACAFILFGKEKFRTKILIVLLSCAVFILALSPWIIRNYVVLKKFVPGTTMGGQVFWEGNNPYSSGGPCRYFPPGIWQVPEKDRDAAFYKETARVIRKNPARFLWLLGNKFIRFWNIVPNAADFSSPLYRVVSVLSFGVLIPFFILGIFLNLENRKALFLVVLIAFFTIFHMVFLASIRYRVPIEPYVILFAASGWFWILDNMRRWKRETISNYSSI